MTPIQLLKAYGRLTNVPANQLGSIPVVITDADREMLAQRNCGCPDLPDAEIAFSNASDLSESLGLSVPECEGLIDSHMRMFAAAVGSGAYPSGCNPAYPGMHSAAYFDDPASWPTHLQRPLTDSEFQSIIDAKVWGTSGNPTGAPFTMAQLKSAWGGKPLNQVVNDFAEETYRRVGIILYPVFTGSNGQHNIHVTYPTIAGSVIGVGWFPGSNPCPGDHVNLHIDRTYTAGFQGQFGLKIHELGHTVQLQHQFSGQNSHQEPMSYSYSNHLVVGYSNGDPVFKLPKSPSLSVLTKLYGGVPVGVPWKGKFVTTPTDPTDPIPPTPPTVKDLPKTLSGPNGVIVVDGQLYKFWMEKA